MMSDKPQLSRPGFRQVNVRLPADLFGALADAARLDHRSLSSALAMAAERYIREVHAQVAREESRERAV